MFHSHGLLVTKADVATERDSATIVLHVTDAEGQAVEERVVEAMRREIGFSILQVKDAPGAIPIPAPKSVDSPGSSFVNMIRSQSERWLFTLGLGGSPPIVGGQLSSSDPAGLAASSRW